MAEERGCAPGPGPGLSRLGTERSLLVVIGALPDRRALEPLLRRVEEGVRCWSVDLDVPSLDEQLKLFVSRHSAFLSEDVPGQRTLQHSGDVLHTEVLLNPTHEVVCAEVQQLVCSSFVYRLLLFVGLCEEETGELLLQRGRFSCSDLLLLLNNTQVDTLRALPVKPALTVCCPSFGCWSGPWVETLTMQGVVDVKVNPVPVLPLMEGLQEFTEYLSESLPPDSPFDLLEPPDAPGFLRLCRPCCYIFPGGRGDSAFFSVCGFNILVNGGSDPRSCFWKLVRHLDRVDSVLLTHCGTDNLPGIISFLQRKLCERHEDQDLDQTKNVISPEVGVVFFNSPDVLETNQGDPSKLRSCDLAEITLQLLQELSITPRPLSRVSGTIKPLILFQKLGVGCLELYTLNPVSGLVHSTDVSISVLLVWHPADPQEKIVRVLFPGRTPQTELLEGLEMLQHLQCLKHPSPCFKDLQTYRAERELSPERDNSRVRSSSQREKCTEPKKATPGPPDEKSKVKEVDIKTRTSKPEKLLTRKDQKEGKVSTPGKKEERKKEPTKKDLISSKPKKEPKRDLKAEPKRDLKKEQKPAEKKSVKAKEVRKSPGAPLEFGSDPPKTARSFRTDEMSLKKGPFRKVDTKVETKDGTNRLKLNGFHRGPEKSVKNSTNGQNVKLDLCPSSEDTLNHNCEDRSPAPCMSGPQKEKDLKIYRSECCGLEETVSAIPQHVDVCLVSPCEFQHLHVPQSRDEGLDSTTPAEGLDLNSPTVAEFSEEEDGGTLRFPDPAPIPIIDRPPPPAQPGSCTVDSEENQKPPSLKTKKLSQQSSSRASCPTFAGSETKISARRTVSGTSRSKVTAAAGSSVPSPGPGSAGPVVYVDLVYLPSGLSSIDADLFRCLRSSHYILSGDDPRKEIRKVLDSLLEGKSCWAELKVTLIPTFDSPVMHEWYQQTLQQQGALSLNVLGSNSTVAMQDECFPACKVELH